MQFTCEYLAAITLQLIPIKSASKRGIELNAEINATNSRYKLISGSFDIRLKWDYKVRKMIACAQRSD